MKPFHLEYALGYLTATGVYLPIGNDRHPWESVIRDELAKHEGDPDWEGVTVICRPVIGWAPAGSPHPAD